MSSTTRRSTPRGGQTLDDRYEIVRRAGRGGMATVYEALDLRLSRTVAVKVMHDGLGADADFASRFDAEARATALLCHPNVVSVFDQGIDGDRPYMVMEYVRGCTLRQLLSREAPLDPLRTLDLLEPVVAALAAAHQAGLVHRDVKPENVLISDRGHVKVADFGLARAVEAAGPGEAGGMVIGTVSYIAPELVSGGHADPRSDVYSLGILTYEMLTGQKPHRGDSPVDVAHAHVHRDVPPPSRALASTLGGTTIPSYLDTFVRTACARHRAQRPADATVLLSHLRTAREALALGVGDDDTLDAVMRQTSVEDADRARERVPAMVAAAAHVTRDVRFTPGLRGTPTLELATDGIPYYSDGGPSPLSPHSPVTRMLPILPPPREWRATAVHRRRRALVGVVALLLTAAIVLGGWWLAFGRLVAVTGMTGLSQGGATALARDSGLRVSTHAEYSETVPAGQVSRTDPGPGTRIEPGATIEVVLSRGPERLEVPELTGLSADAAVRALAALGLDTGTVTRARDDDVEAGHVLSQSTPGGILVPRGAAIDYVVSDGPAPVTIGRFSGRPTQQVRRELRAAGLFVRVVGVRSATVPAGLIVGQDAVGTVHRGDTIRLTQSLGARPSG